MYEMSCGLIYEMMSKRIKTKRESLNIKSKDILEDNPSLMSAISNNRRHPKKNPYLIPDTYVSTIQEKLKFKSKSELLFGDYSEIESYSEKLFFFLIYETITMSENEGKKFSTNSDEDILNIIDAILLSLMDYVPYAFISLYVEEENNPVTNHVFPEEMRHLIYDYKKIIIYAIIRLYNKNSDFNSILHEFFYTLNSTVKLDKSFLSFVKKNLVELISLSEVEKELYSLGYRFYKTLSGLRETTYKFFIDDCYIADKRYLSDDENYLHNIIESLIDINKEYAYKLYLLQKKEDPYFPKNNPNWDIKEYEAVFSKLNLKHKLSIKPDMSIFKLLDFPKMNKTIFEDEQKL